jgi:hypothetical protein
VDEGLEERDVLALFGMPEDTESEAPRRILDCLDRSVVGPSGPAKSCAEPAERLMVMRLHRRPVSENPTDQGFRPDTHFVVGELTGRMQMAVVAHDLGQVLNEVAAERDVQNLAAATYGENRHVPLKRLAEQLELGLVALWVDPSDLVVGVGAVRVRIDVPTAREDEAVERVERLLEADLGRRDDEWPATCAVDGADVGRRYQDRLDVPRAPSDGLLVRGDPDQRGAGVGQRAPSRSPG